LGGRCPVDVLREWDFAVRSRVQSITPKRAAELLAANTTNRPLSRPVVRGFAEAMKRGEWLVTIQGIAFDVNGVLVDGDLGPWLDVASHCSFV